MLARQLSHQENQPCFPPLNHSSLPTAARLRCRPQYLTVQWQSSLRESPSSSIHCTRTCPRDKGMHYHCLHTGKSSSQFQGRVPSSSYFAPCCHRPCHPSGPPIVVPRCGYLEPACRSVYRSSRVFDQWACLMLSRSTN